MLRTLTHTVPVVEAHRAAQTSSQGCLFPCILQPRAVRASMSTSIFRTIVNSQLFRVGSMCRDDKRLQLADDDDAA